MHITENAFNRAIRLAYEAGKNGLKLERIVIVPPRSASDNPDGQCIAFFGQQKSGASDA